MFEFLKGNQEQNKQSLLAMQDAIMFALKETLSKVERSNADTQKAVTDLVTERKLQDSLNVLKGIGKPSQQDVITTGVGSAGNLFSIRYRNDTATTNVANIHRLEWIARSSAYDPQKLADATLTEADMNGDYAHDHPYMWDDALWTPVVGGVAVEYVP